MPRSFRLFTAAALMAAALLPTLAAAPVSASGEQVSISEDRRDDPKTWGFRPRESVVKVGTTVVWTNRGTNANVHTVTSDNGVFDSRDLAPGAVFKRRFDTAGEFRYHCTPHPWMTGVVRVVAR